MEAECAGHVSHVILAQERKRQEDRNVRPVKVVLRTCLNEQQKNKQEATEYTDTFQLQMNR